MSSHPRKEYKDLINYIHNELGVTKEDIKLWVKEATYEVAEQYVDKQFSIKSLDDRIMQATRNRNMSIWSDSHASLDSYIKDKVVSELKKNIKLKVEIDNV